jgi:hypothetical protein
VTATIPVRHGSFVVDVPATWSDQSTLVFVAPPAMLPTLSAQAAVESVTVRFGRGASVDAVVDAELAALRERDPALVVLWDRPERTAGGAGRAAAFTTSIAAVPLTQILCVIDVDGVFVIGAATCAAVRFAAVEAQLRAVLASVRPAP